MCGGGGTLCSITLQNKRALFREKSQEGGGTFCVPVCVTSWREREVSDRHRGLKLESGGTVTSKTCSRVGMPMSLWVYSLTCLLKEVGFGLERDGGYPG